VIEWGGLWKFKKLMRFRVESGIYWYEIFTNLVILEEMGDKKLPFFHFLCFPHYLG